MALWSKKSKTKTDIENEIMPRTAAKESSDNVGETGAAIGEVSAKGALSKDQLTNMKTTSKQMSASFGEIVALLMETDRYKAVPLAELKWRIKPAVAHRQFSLAEAQSQTVGVTAPVALVMWAKVSADIDRELSTISKKPLRLEPGDWVGGSNFWVIDAIGDPKLIKAMFKHLMKNEWSGQKVKMRLSTTDDSFKIVELNEKAQREETS